MIDGSIVIAWVSWSVACINAGAMLATWTELTVPERVTPLGISAVAAWVALWAWR